MKNIFVVFIALLLIIAMTGCGKQNESVEYTIIGINGDTCYCLNEDNNKIISVNLTEIDPSNRLIGSCVLFESATISIK